MCINFAEVKVISSAKIDKDAEEPTEQPVGADDLGRPLRRTAFTCRGGACPSLLRRTFPNRRGALCALSSKNCIHRRGDRLGRPRDAKDGVPYIEAPHLRKIPLFRRGVGGADGMVFSENGNPMFTAKK